MAAFILLSDAIDEKNAIDPRYTCDIDNSSPELRWRDPPEGTQSFAVIVEAVAQPNAAVAMVDSRERPVPIAPTGFAHWLVYNIPASVLHLPAGIPPQDVLPNGIRQGLNSLGKLGHTGPCPPRSQPARTYAYRVFALSITLELSSRLTQEKLWEQIQPHILAEAEIRGHYRRLPAAMVERDRAG